MTTFTGSAEDCSTGDEDKPAGNETGVGEAGAMCWQGRQAGLRSAAGIPWVKGSGKRLYSKCTNGREQGVGCGERTTQADGRLLRLLRLLRRMFSGGVQRLQARQPKKRDRSRR